MRAIAIMGTLALSSLLTSTQSVYAAETPAEHASGAVWITAGPSETPPRVQASAPVAKAAFHAPARSSARRSPARSSRSQSSASGLPGGRRYYQGRYFGNFNNRFYGPQYGYF